MAARKTLVHLRFNEASDDVAPSDAVGSLADLAAPGTLPPVVDGFTGFARALGDTQYFAALDVVPGASLSTRDVTVQAILEWDFDAQVALAIPGPICLRGDDGGGAAEINAYRVELRVVNVAARIGELRFTWATTGGAPQVQLGGHFIVPPSGFLMLTATRRWVSSGEVEIQYYVGDRLIGDHVSVNGDIGGGTTGSFLVGGNPNDTSWLTAKLDELRVLNYHVTHEEVEATWLRLSKFQPRGYKAIRDLFQPDAPVSNDPASRFQKLLRIAGHAIGYSAAQAENIKLNQLPDRAYGPALEQWESVLGEAPRAPDSVARRRRRCSAHFSQRQGVSPPGVVASTGELLVADETQLQIVAFDQTTVDTFETLNELRWTYEPTAKWTIAANALRVLGVDAGDDWVEFYNARQSIGGKGRGAEMIAKLTPTTITNNSEVGIMFADRARRHAILFGYRRDNGGVLRLVTELALYGVLQGATIQNSPAGLNPVWLHLRAQADYTGLGAQQTRFDARWSFASGAGPFTESLNILAGFRDFHWACFYARALTAAAPSVDVAIDDCRVRTPYGDRTLWFYVRRDPTLPGSPDYVGANGVISRLKHANTDAAAVKTLEAKYDSDDTTYDGPPMGGI